MRLQTFPDNWYLHGTRMERAFQIGNAVPPLLAKTVGTAILDASADVEIPGMGLGADKFARDPLRERSKVNA